MKNGRSQRRLANMLLQPFTQLRIGLVNLGLSLCFVLALGGFAYLKLVDFAEVIATLTEANDEVAKLLSSYLNGVGLTALIASLAFIAINLVASVYLTHRLVGPTVAFRRHIDQLIAGDFQARTKLRKDDAFHEVAADLNRLTDSLQRGRQEKATPDQLNFTARR